MVTTIGTGSDRKALFQSFLVLEQHATAACAATIERLDDHAHLARITGFRSNHQRHVSEWKGMAARHGIAVPGAGGMKEMRTPTGKVKIAGRMGGESAAQSFERALSDERRHKPYMETAPGSA